MPPLSKVFESKKAGQKTTLKLKFAKKATKAIRRALKRKRLTAKVTVSTHGVGAAASQSSSSTRKIKLRR